MFQEETVAEIVDVDYVTLAWMAIQVHWFGFEFSEQ